MKKHTNIVAAYLVLVRDEKVLLLKRKNTGYCDGQYSVIAGHVEPGETFTQTIIREAREEAGITLQPEDLKVAHVMHRKSSHDASERVDVCFIATRWSGEICNKEPQKCSELTWFRLDDLPETVIPCVRTAIEHTQGNIFYSEYGW